MRRNTSVFVIVWCPAGREKQKRGTAASEANEPEGTDADTRHDDEDGSLRGVRVRVHSNCGVSGPGVSIMAFEVARDMKDPLKVQALPVVVVSCCCRIPALLPIRSRLDSRPIQPGLEAILRTALPEDVGLAEAPMDAHTATNNQIHHRAVVLVRHALRICPIVRADR